MRFKEFNESTIPVRPVEPVYKSHSTRTPPKFPVYTPPEEKKKDEKPKDDSIVNLIAEKKKKRKKKKVVKKAKLARYYYPGFGYYGLVGNDSGDAGGGDGGGESMYEGEVVSLQDKKIAQIVKQYPIIFATGSRTQGVDDVNLIFKDLRTNKIVAHVVGNNYKPIEINGKILGGASYEIRINRQGLTGEGGPISYLARGNPNRDEDVHFIFTLVPSKKKIEKTPGPGGTTKLRPDQSDVVNYMMTSGTYYGYDLIPESNEDWHTFLQKALGGKFMDEDLAVELGYVYRKYDGDLVFLQEPQTADGEKIAIPQDDWERQEIESPYEPRTPNLKYFNLDDIKEEKSDTSVNIADEVKKFAKWACQKLSIQKPPKISLSYNTKEAQSGHHTGKHVQGSDNVWVYVANRNLVDILRTVFHELVHWRQNELGMIKAGDSYPGSPIEAQADMLAGKYIKIYGKDNQKIFQ